MPRGRGKAPIGGLGERQSPPEAEAFCISHKNVINDRVVKKYGVGVVSNVQNYRPISLTCVISKIMERIVAVSYTHLTLPTNREV